MVVKELSVLVFVLGMISAGISYLFNNDQFLSFILLRQRNIQSFTFQRCLIIVASIKCYTGTNSDYKELDCSTLLSVFNKACQKTVVGDNTGRTCGGNPESPGCVENTSPLGIKSTVCTCTTDLCNNGYDLKMSSSFLTLMSLLVMVIVHPCLKMIFV